MTTGFGADDSRRGSMGSLGLLYGAVPAAEELDLREELEWERAWEWLMRFSHPDFAELEIIDDTDAGPDNQAEPELTLNQAVGMVGHLLGGVVVE